MADHDHNPASGHAGSEPGARPRWLIPGLLVTLVAGGLVAAGVVSLSAVLYAGLLGGMMLMHLGGHGHALHGGSRGADLDRGSEDAVPGGRSVESQAQAPAPGTTSEQRTVTDPSTTATRDDAHRCH